MNEATKSQQVTQFLEDMLQGVGPSVALGRDERLDGWTKLFLSTTALTSVTGFFFVFHGVTPGIVIGIISLVTLAVAIFARYQSHLTGAWRKTYVATALLALYFNVFVLIVQSFQKIPALKNIAPKQSDSPFKFTQLVVLVVFIVLGILAAIRLQAEPLSVSSSSKEMTSTEQIQT